ncbi:hypothetical protein DPMN_052885 [Dreissena polymorpha]|uniref:Uncharacterized protein n=1 Tax=Dreissena polymorpha TaxID=45954 RepID=A0A9D4CKE0_DREPO|nr:hypothetical protein DPMN_052885 [Dreissena polymorpha]
MQAFQLVEGLKVEAVVGCRRRGYGVHLPSVLEGDTDHVQVDTLNRVRIYTSLALGKQG